MMIPGARDTVVLIPAAGPAPEGVLALSNIGSPALIPAGGRPVIHWTLSYLLSQGFSRFIIAVARRGGFLEDFVESAFGGRCEVGFITPSSQGGLGQTVLDLSMASTAKSALVVLGDTYFRFRDEEHPWDHPFVLVSPVSESYRWCVAEVGTTGEVLRLRDKEPGLEGPLRALIGVYYFPDRVRLEECARQTVDAANAGSAPAQMKGILDRVRETSSLRAIPSERWLDCGNPDGQAASHRALLQSRAFNELAVDTVAGTITKRSKNASKLIDEINYQRLLPPELSVLFPRMTRFSVDWNAPFVEMEYYGYPSLSDVFVFENVDAGVWERVFEHLFSIVTTRFMSIRCPLRPEAALAIYLDKTRDRLEKLTEPPELLALLHAAPVIRLNGRPVPNLMDLLERLEPNIRHLAENLEASVIHGDFCFSNILYDMRSRLCKLIDPRGSFGATGIYGDPRYDVAKLYHSVRGFYDFIVNDLFKVVTSPNAIDLTIRCRSWHLEVRDRFERIFFRRFEKEEIVLITGLLFASMLPLHFDGPERQLAMYGMALAFLTEALTGQDVVGELVR
jgi:dTDP-glucose pyrophosphorylase